MRFKSIANIWGPKRKFFTCIFFAISVVFETGFGPNFMVWTILVKIFGISDRNSAVDGLEILENWLFFVRTSGGSTVVEMNGPKWHNHGESERFIRNWTNQIESLIWVVHLIPRLSTSRLFSRMSDFLIFKIEFFTKAVHWPVRSPTWSCWTVFLGWRIVSLVTIIFAVICCNSIL